MRILVDILTPKQALFLGELSERLEDAGHEVFRVTRNFKETVRMLKMKGLKAEIVGSHSLTLMGKLQESLRRTSKLAYIMKGHKVDCALGFSSVEAARAAFGLSIPYYCISDSPHAEAVSRLTIPLSSKLFTPKVIPKDDWTRYGIHPSRIIHYNALDPYVWIKDVKPDPHYLRRNGIDPESRIVTLRLEESFAAYLMGVDGDWRGLASKILEGLLRRGCGATIIVLPRYDEHLANLKKFRGRVIVPRSMIYGATLLASTSVFIGGGGTMTAEASMMGVPAISYFPAGPTRVETFLEERSLLKRLTDPESIVEQTISWLMDNDYRVECRRKATALLKEMEDPLKVIVQNLLSSPATP
ncbi:MAG: DUF354 domain-containing protein [Candidatus Bathyarchaeia archaeon]